MSKVRNHRPAVGTKGILIRSGGTFVFRVYKEGHDFVDYDIHHYDMSVEITDDGAFFYEDEFGACIDYAPYKE